jgi:hypothetical protein
MVKEYVWVHPILAILLVDFPVLQLAFTVAVMRVFAL